MPSPGLYVETEISLSLEEIWRLTQEPALHERWDLRFSTIHYLPCGAWSFDQLRRWAENGVRPEQVRRATLIYAVARCTVIFLWAWHGLLPKLLLHDTDELRLVTAQHLPAMFVSVARVLEIVLAVMGILTWPWRGYGSST